MAYYTGTEVKVWIQTEHATRGIQVNSNQLEMVDNSSDAYDQVEIFGRNLVGKSGYNLPDITGVELTQGAQDEEISYFGTKTPGKIETKADMALTLTRKKSDKLWSTLAQGDTASGKSRGTGGHGGRWGLVLDSGGSVVGDMVMNDGTVDPKGSKDENGAVCYGFRVAIQLKAASSGGSDGAVIVLRNCTMGEYTTTMSNDSANEETIQFVSMVKPLILNGKVHTDGYFDAGNDATAAADM